MVNMNYLYDNNYYVSLVRPDLQRKFSTQQDPLSQWFSVSVSSELTIAVYNHLMFFYSLYWTHFQWMEYKSLPLV